MPVLLRCLVIFLMLLGPMASMGANVAAQSAADESVRFISLSDIHFDPFMFCTERPCPVFEKLKAAPVSEWAKIFSENKSRQQIYREDSNYALLKSSLGAAKKIADLQNAKFVVVLGDVVGHSFRYYYPLYSKSRNSVGYEEFVKKTVQFVANEIQRAFPSMNVYMTVGNNDSYVDDYYVARPNAPFYSDTVAAWSPLIKNAANRAAMQREFPVGGYYAVDVPMLPKLRLIVLNSVMFSDRARGKELNRGANEQMRWLHQQLEEVRANHQKALIAMHIPVGIDVYASLKIRMFTLIEFWDPKYTARFRAELQEFSPDIAGILTGHLHSDWFQILKMSNSNDIPVSSTPSISPIFGNNPGFKVYTYSPRLQQLEDYVTYYFPLSRMHTWESEYEFSQVYQPNCRVCPIIKGMERLGKKGDLAEQFKLYYAVSTTAQPITTKWNPYYWCAIRNNAPDDYHKCIS